RASRATYPGAVRAARSAEAVAPLFGLAPGGVYRAVSVTGNAVRSYRTISPLPRFVETRRYIFCGTFRRLAPPRRYLAPCPLEPGLSSPRVCGKHGERLSGRLPEGV